LPGRTRQSATAADESALAVPLPVVEM
jgi:hypothetical protein